MLEFFIVAVLVLAPWIFQRWQRGIFLLLAYIPFAGVVTLSLYPSSLPMVFKDIVFVIPAYLSFFLAKRVKSRQVRIPPLIGGIMIALAVVVLSQMFNPGVANWVVAAIGAKVWLFYLPMLFLAFAMIESQDDMVKILRLMVVIAWVPCTVGIAQWLGSMQFGYEETMETFYGEAAKGATQNFARMEAGGTYFRIPATFSFVAQYFGYTLAMIVPAYALMRLDVSPNWRRFSTCTFALVIVASFLSGARAAFLFVPLLLALTALLDGRASGMTVMAIASPILLFVGLYIGGIDPFAMYNMVSELTLTYADEIAYGGLVEALQSTWLGVGTGMNTGAARYGFAEYETFIGIENYYAKAFYELGIGGFGIVVGLFLSIIIHGYNIHRHIHGKEMKSVSAAILAFIITMSLNSFKGWLIDLDPINVYFWIFAGFIFKLKYLDSYAYDDAGHIDPGNRMATA